MDSGFILILMHVFIEFDIEGNCFNAPDCSFR